MQESLVFSIDNIGWAAFAAIIAGVIRSITGWFENSYKDGEISDFEWKQLFGTLVKYIAAVLLLLFGLKDIGLAVATTFGLDAITSALKEISK
jgi:hypothetical protein